MPGFELGWVTAADFDVGAPNTGYIRQTQVHGSTGTYPQLIGHWHVRNPKSFQPWKVNTLNLYGFTWINYLRRQFVEFVICKNLCKYM